MTPRVVARAAARGVIRNAGYENRANEAPEKVALRVRDG